MLSGLAMQTPRESQAQLIVWSAPKKEESGHFRFVKGTTIDRNEAYPSGRYEVIRSLGAGVYGTVFECHDRKHGCSVAIKMCKAQKEFMAAAREEIRVLKDVRGLCNTPQLLRDFVHENHICMSFNMLGDSLKSTIERKGAFSFDETCHITKQLLSALEYVHGKGIVHTDVKPDNILLSYRDGNYAKATLIDFGSAIYLEGRRQANIGTPGYIAPEALLQADWNAAVDMWGAGCVVAEIASGKALFPASGKCDLYLYCMQTALEAPIPQTLIRSVGKFPDRSNPMRPPVVDTSGMIPIPASGTGKFSPAPLPTVVQNVELLSLLRQILALDPTVRITASQALAKLNGQSDSISSSAKAVEVFEIMEPVTAAVNSGTETAAESAPGPTLVIATENAQSQQTVDKSLQNHAEIESIDARINSGTELLVAATTSSAAGQPKRSDASVSSPHSGDAQLSAESPRISSAVTQSFCASIVEHIPKPHLQLQDALSPEIEFEACRPPGPASPESSAKNSFAKTNPASSDVLERNTSPVRMANLVEPAGPSRTTTAELRHIPELGVGWPGDQGLPRSGSADPWIMMPSFGPGHVGSSSFTVSYTAGFTAGAVWSPYGQLQSTTWSPITTAPAHFGGWQQ